MSKESAVRNNIWKWLVLLLIAVVSFYVTTPVQEKLRFGLDLKGGTSFTLGVDTERLAESIIAENPAITNTPGAVQAKIDETLKDCDSRIIEVIRRRVDAMGTNEPVIQGMKDHRLLVQLPGVDEEVRKAAKASLQSAAYLEFRLTHAKNDQLVAKLLSKDVAPEGYVKKGSGYARAENWKEVSKTPGYAARLAAFEVPDPRYAFMLEDNGDGTYSPNFVARRTDPQVTGEHLESAAVERDPTTGNLSIGFRLNSEGAQKFATLTRNYKAGGPKNPTGRGRQLAIVLDDQLISAPVIQSEIGANGQITGRFDGPSAQKLANELNAGALPAPMKILAESSVSPTVGEDAKQAGMVAAVLGFCLVAVFMFIYYWMTGLVADIALFLDIALLPTALVFVANILGVFAHDPAMGGGGSMQLPVLTMPGIAGLVLSLGMAVDANVLIFERIREEFAAGRRAGEAIKNGYGRDLRLESHDDHHGRNPLRRRHGPCARLRDHAHRRRGHLDVHGRRRDSACPRPLRRFRPRGAVQDDAVLQEAELRLHEAHEVHGRRLVRVHRGRACDLRRALHEQQGVSARRGPHWRHLDSLQPQAGREARDQGHPRGAQRLRQRDGHPVPGGRRRFDAPRQDRRDG